MSSAADLAFDERYAEGKPERVPALIGELLAAQVDVLVTPGNAATLAAHKATATVPIVYVGDDLDPNRAHGRPRPAGRQCHRRRRINRTTTGGNGSNS